MAGSFSYNEGLIGKPGPAGVDAYNRGTIGSKNLGIKEPYNKGTIGNSNPNYGWSFSNVGSNWGLNGPGSRPEALHTEYATDESSTDRAYGTQDLIFYLQRADGGDGGGEDGPSDNFNKNSGTDSGEEFPGGAPFADDSRYDTAEIDAIGETGPNPVEGGQTAPNQIAAKSAAPNSFRNVTGAHLGVITELSSSMDLASPLDSTSQTSVDVEGGNRLILNAIQSVPNLEQNEVLQSLAASEHMFNQVLSRSFTPNESLDGPRTAEQIKKSLSRPPTAKLAVDLARATRGVRRVEDLITLVNSGEIGLTSTRTRAAQSRLNSQGRNTRSMRRNR